MHRLDTSITIKLDYMKSFDTNMYRATFYFMQIQRRYYDATDI